MTQDVPEWALKMSEEVVAIIRATQDDFVPQVWFASMEERIANRLVQAYERGQESMRERAAAEAWLHSKQGSTHDQIAEAIRSLPIEQEGGK